MFSHKSGDEATIEEAIAFARLIHKLNVRVAHLWAGEFEKGALDAIWHTLQQLENRSLSLADICDVSLSAPDDRIRHQGIESLVAENRKVSGPVSSIVGSTE